MQSSAILESVALLALYKTQGSYTGLFWEICEGKESTTEEIRPTSPNVASIVKASFFPPWRPAW